MPENSTLKPLNLMPIFQKSIKTLILLFFAASLMGQPVENASLKNAADSILIWKIEIEKNWITWDRIIKNELLFEEGDWVRIGQIDTSMNKVWNIGNFANVEYTLAAGPKGDTLKIQALDAVKFYPLISIDHSSENDYKYRLGAGDDNFLGSNAKLKVAWEKTPIAVKWDFSLGIPRQLMYKNMTAKIGFAKGNETKVFLDRVITDINGKKEASYNTLMMAPYDKTEFYAEIGNPWHQDYHYRFSPNLSLRFNQHTINHSILSQEDLDLAVHVPYEEYTFLKIGFSESIGTVNSKRHRFDGYTAQLAYDLNLGFRGTDNFHSITAEGEYHKSFNEIIQGSFWARTGYTTADDHYRFIKGSSDVLGLRTGEIFGKAYYSAYAGTHFTWLNTKWIALENAYFINFGNGAEDYGTLFSDTPKAAAGTYLEITFPIAPLAAFRFTFMYAGPGSEWFKFNLK